MTRRTSTYGLHKVVTYLPYFVSYVFRHFPSAKLALAVAALGVVFEYAALSVMLPLAGSSGQQGGDISSAAVESWQYIASLIGMPDESRTWLWLFLLLLGIRIAIGFAQIALNTWVSKSILAHLSGGTFSRIVMHEPLGEIYHRTVGYYTALAGDEAVRIGQVFFHLAQTMSALMAAAIGLLVLFVFSPLAFNLTLLFLLVSGLSLGLALKRIFSWSSESVSLSREANTTFIEAFNGIRSIRSMAGEEFVSQRYNNLIKRYSRVLFLLDAFNFGSRSLPALILIALGLVVLFPYGGASRDFTVVYFFTVTTMLIRVLSFFGTAASSSGRIAIDIRAAFDLDEIIGSSVPSRPPAEAREPISEVRKISMSKLSCGYLAGYPVLNNISAQLVAGRSYAIVGRSGSGKSTLSDVLLGLLSPTSGELHIGELPYDQADLTSLRHKVVLVEQQTRIFSGSLRENIAFGLFPTDAEVQAAVEASGLSEFVNSLPAGLETHLDYQGANLSGGQRQRIGLARAIVRQPDVLILDEATSALDGQTRDLILQHLWNIYRDKILVFVTHDNHVIQAVDEVWHIKKGQLIIETGQVTHD